ncbi:hypothetical protein [Pseudomonas eucalypticola]|uniref:Uncharacterized protein n=1 Tax=Pseudomonas eucalypticola TaxID=2599595 RepID=A0A7D5DA03_9PSED|nr:hypothetical protein [Pseudomonas eucalypticola]QKZ05121.1 hypothetical protein HWQ56_15515 [Pseudomonas eucalypticola]
MERYATGGVDTTTVDLDVLLAGVPEASAAKGRVRAVLQALAEVRAVGASAKSAAQVELGSAKAVAEARAAEASAQSTAPGELGSANAIEEALKATSLTAVTDEMSADAYHPDWQRYVGGEPRAVGADVVEIGAKAIDSAEVPAISAVARVGLRDDLAAQAGIPRNIAESPASMWGKSIDDIKQSLMLDGASLTPKAPLAGTSGRAQVFNVEGHPTIKEVEFHPGGGTHGDSPYYKLVGTEKVGNKNIEIRVIDPSRDLVRVPLRIIKNIMIPKEIACGMRVVMGKAGDDL